ncbi:MAG: hypothetical protein DYH13_02410 [Alphaproteobacteria bacterium PRO2]|nr:hypothetical protein [Alphaproteobacteria bacterium PRO2]
MADNDIGGMFGRALGNLKDSVVEGTKRKAQETVDQKTREAQEAAKRKAMEKSGITDQNLRDAQDPVGAAQRKLEEKTREAGQAGQRKINEGMGNVERGVGNKIDETTGKATQEVQKGVKGAQPGAMTLEERERAIQEEVERKAAINRNTPRGPSELHLKEQAAQEELTRKLEAAKEEAKRNPPPMSEAERKAIEEQQKYMKPKGIPQSFEGTPTTPSGAIPISYEGDGGLGTLNPQSKGDLSGEYGKALGLNQDEPAAVPSAKPGQTFKI